MSKTNAQVPSWCGVVSFWAPPRAWRAPPGHPSGRPGHELVNTLDPGQIPLQSLPYVVNAIQPREN